MAGSVTQTRQSNARIVKSIPTEVIVTLVCVSDSSTGLVPSTTLTGLGEYVLTEAWPVPHASTPFTSAFEFSLEDTTTAVNLFLSGSVAVDSLDIIAGNAGTETGGYPRPNTSMTFKIVDPSDHASTLDVGNSKTHTIQLRFESQA
jgi:hypothetical protein